ncbi:MAG TPA: hypothetical protein PKC40_07725 [Saprospiraceae bacterium]|nr:hypothetical protein [Saprospiraceae bacterium]
MDAKSNFQQTVWQGSMIAAPLFIAISQFYWVNGQLSVTAGWLQVLAFTFWIVAFHGMFSMIKENMPKYYTIGLLIAGYACIGGAGFGYDGIYTSAFGYSTFEETNAFHSKIGVPLIPALFLPGLFFPLSLLILGVQLIRAKRVQPWIGILLMLAAIGFPLSRVPRIDMIAHLDNVLLLASHFLIAFKAKTIKL